MRRGGGVSKSIGTYSGEFALADLAITLGDLESIQGTAEHAFATLKGKLRTGLNRFLETWWSDDEGNISFRDAINGATSLLLQSYIQAFRFGMRYELGSTTQLNLTLEQQSWVNTAAFTERDFFEGLMRDIRYNRVKDWSARLELYVKTLDAIYDAGRVAGRAALGDFEIVHWIVDDEAEHCVAGDTLIQTPTGLVPISSLQSTDLSLPSGEVGSSGGVVSRGVQPTVIVTSSRGYSVRCTPNHLFLAATNSSHELIWVEAKDLVPGTHFLVMPRGLAPTTAPTLSLDLCEFLGVVMGDGWVYRSTRRPADPGGEVGYILLGEELWLAEKYNTSLKTLNLPPFSITEDRKSVGVYRIRSSNSEVLNFVSSFGLRDRYVTSRLLSLSSLEISSFLRGWFEADGHVARRSSKVGGIPTCEVSLSTTSKYRAELVQKLLFSVGVLSTLRTSERVTNYSKGEVSVLYLVVILGGSNLSTFIDNVGFAGKRKTALLARPTQLETRGDTYPVRVFGKSSSPTLERIFRNPDVGPKLPAGRVDAIRSWLSSKYHFSPIESVVPFGEEEVFDVMDSSSGYFVGNGFVLHNCEGCLILEANSPYTLNNLPCTPKDGSTQCLSNCKCRLFIDPVSREEFVRVQVSQRPKESLLVDINASKQLKLGTYRGLR